MSTIRTVYTALDNLMVVDFPKVSTAEYMAAADPFSAEYQPRGTDLTTYYIDPPISQSSGLVSGGEDVQTQITIWLSHEAGEDARGAALDLSDDLAALRRMVLALDVEGVNLHDRITTAVLPRRQGDVVVIGRLAFTIGYIEAD